MNGAFNATRKGCDCPLASLTLPFTDTFLVTDIIWRPIFLPAPPLALPDGNSVRVTGSYAGGDFANPTETVEARLLINTQSFPLYTGPAIIPPNYNQFDVTVPYSTFQTPWIFGVQWRKDFSATFPATLGTVGLITLTVY